MPLPALRRDDFPALDRLTYLNTASAGLVPASVVGPAHEFEFQWLPLTQTARRMEYSTMSYSAAIALGRATGYISGLCLDDVADHNRRLASQLAEGLSERGAMLLTPPRSASPRRHHRRPVPGPRRRGRRRRADPTRGDPVAPGRLHPVLDALLQLQRRRWTSWDAITAFAGDDVSKAVLYPEDHAAEAAGQHDLDLARPPRNELDRRGGCGPAGSGVVMAAFGSRGRRVPG